MMINNVTCSYNNIIDIYIWLKVSKGIKNDIKMRVYI